MSLFSGHAKTWVGAPLHSGAGRASPVCWRSSAGGRGMERRTEWSWSEEAATNNSRRREALEKKEEVKGTKKIRKWPGDKRTVNRCIQAENGQFLLSRHVPSLSVRSVVAVIPNLSGLLWYAAGKPPLSLSSSVWRCLVSACVFARVHKVVL